MKKLSDEELISMMRSRGFPTPSIPVTIPEAPLPPQFKSNADVIRRMGGRPGPEDSKPWDEAKNVKETDYDRAEAHLKDARKMVVAIERILEQGNERSG